MSPNRSCMAFGHLSWMLCIFYVDLEIPEFSWSHGILKEIEHPPCLQSSLELMFSNKSEEATVVFPKQETVSAACQNTVLCHNTGFSSQPLSKLGSANLPAY